VTTWERALDDFSEALNMLVELKEIETNWGV
jgi:vacuolar-type H+-ATPase subunit D/Vma8